MSFRRILAGASAITLAFGATAFLPAANINVPGDQPTITAAIAAANATGDTITLVNVGPYVESFIIDKNVTIQAATGVTPVVRIPLAGPTITIGASSIVTLDGITFDGSLNDIALDINTVTLSNGCNLTVTDCRFENGSGVTLRARDLTVAFTLLVQNSVLTNNGQGAILVRNCSGIKNTVTIENCTIDGWFDDCIRVRNNSPIDFVLRDSEIFGADPGNGGDGVQVGGAGANSTFLIENNYIHGIEDTAIEPDAASNAVYAIRNNTVIGVGTCVRFDTTAFTGAATVQYNIFAEWDQSLTAGAPDKGWAIANGNSQPGISENFNVFADSLGAPAQYRLNVTAGTDSEVATSLVGIFCSTNSLDADFLNILTNGPAFNIDGASNNAGAFPSCAPSLSAENWLLFQ